MRADTRTRPATNSPNAPCRLGGWASRATVRGVDLCREPDSRSSAAPEVERLIAAYLDWMFYFSETQDLLTSLQNSDIYKLIADDDLKLYAILMTACAVAIIVSTYIMKFLCSLLPVVLKIQIGRKSRRGGGEYLDEIKRINENSANMLSVAVSRIIKFQEKAYPHGAKCDAFPQ